MIAVSNTCWRSRRNPGASRDTLMDMAREWGRLADEQERASDLRKKG